MLEKITLVNKRTYQKKAIKVGTDWDWSLFLSPLLLCIPLLIRKLYTWAMFIILLSLINASLIYIFMFLIQSFVIIILFILTMFISLNAQIFLANNGNNMSLTRHLENGWQVKDNN